MKTLKLLLSLSRTGAVAAGLLAAAIAVEGSLTSASANVGPGAKGAGLPTQRINNPEVVQLLSKADAAMKDGDLAVALIYLKNAVSLMPHNGMVRTQLGITLLRTGNFPDAEAQLRQARLEGAPDQVVLPALFDAMLARGKNQAVLDEFPEPASLPTNKVAADILKARSVAFERLGQPAEAVAEMDRSLAVRRDLSGLLARGRLAQQQGDLALAKSLSDEALKIDSGSVDILIFKISLALQMRDDKEALALAESVARAHPESLAARSARIEVYLKLNMDSKAKPEVDALLAAKHNLPSGIYYRALLLARAKQVKEAWRIAETLPPEFVQSEPNIATIVAEMAAATGNSETAAAILTSALTRNPDLVEMRLRLASIRLQQNSPENALGVLTPLKDSSDARAQTLLAETYLKLERYSEALVYLERASASEGQNDLLKRQLALTEIQVGKSDEGIKSLYDLAAKQPANFEIAGQLIGALSQAKRYGDALKVAEKLAESAPKSPVPAFYEGQLLSMTRDPTGALAALGQSLAIDPNYIPSLYYRAGVYESLGKLVEANHDLQQILAHDPKNVSALIKSAEVAAQARQDAEVTRLLGRAISVAPQDPMPRLALANFYMSRGNLKAAKAADADLLHILPSNAEGLALSGALQWASGEKGQAVETYRRLAVLMPKTVGVRMLLSRALSGTGDSVGAVNALEDAVRIDPDSVQARVALINLKSATGDTAGAVQDATDYASGHAGTDSDLMLSNAYIHNKQPDQAIAVLTKSFASRPDSRVLINLAHVLVTNGKVAHGEKLLADWVASHPNDTNARREYASLLLEGGYPAAAKGQYEIVIKMAPKDAVALNNLGWLIQNDDPQRALSLVTQAVQINSNSAEIVDTFGWLKFQQHDVKGALPALQQAHSLRASDPEISYHLVLALDAAGRRNDAKVLLKSVLAGGANFADLNSAKVLATSWH